MNRMVVHGTFVLGKEVSKHPDMGYSFCNCKDIFYTNRQNVTNPHSYLADEDGVISIPDPFFAWPDPYQFLYWDVRKYEILWQMEGLVDHLKTKGYKVLSAERDFDLNSKTPQHFHIKVES